VIIEVLAEEISSRIEWKIIICTWFNWFSFRIRWTSWLNGFISGNVVNFNRNLIGYGYEREEDEDEDVVGTGAGTGTGIGGVSLLGVTKGGVVVCVPASFNFDGHEYGRFGCFNGSNNSYTLPDNNSDGDVSIPISIKFGSSIDFLWDIKPFFSKKKF